MVRSFRSLHGVWLVALALTLGVGCSDDGGGPTPDTGAPDQGNQLDSTVDAPMTDDTGTPDMNMVGPEASVDLAPQDEMGVDQGTADQAVTDAAPVDTAVDAAPVVPICSKATALPLTAGAGSASGEVAKTDTDNDVQLAATGCMGQESLGADRFYSVQLTAGTMYSVTVVPDYGTGESTYNYNVGVYVSSDCNDMATGCVAGKDTGYSGDTEQLFFTPSTTGTYYIGIDSRYAPGTSWSYGKYELTVKEITPPQNDQCSNAESLTFTDGVAEVTASTVGAANDVKLTASDCTGNTTDGPDVFYTASLTAGNTYKFELDGTGFNEALYVFTSCGNVPGTCGTNMGDDSSTSAAESVLYTPTTSGPVFIGVSGRDAADFGDFTLTVTDLGALPSDTCGGATAITLTSGKAEVIGHNYGATDTVNLPNTGCTGDDTEGGDVFYSLNMTAGYTYNINVAPESGFNVSLYVLDGCTSPTTACVAGDDTGYSGASESVSYTPTTSGSYIIVVDSRYPAGDTYSQGSFTLNVEEFPPPQNDLCQSATPLTLSGGGATVQGYTLSGTNAVDLTASDCTGNTTSGPDVFYSVQLTGGNTYKIGVSSSDFNEVIYVFSDCGNVASTCVQGADASTSSSEGVTITPSATATYIIGVDGRASDDAGNFELQVLEFGPVQNDTCQTASAVTLNVGSPTTISGHNVGSTDTVNLANTGCTGDDTEGGDVFYKVNLTGGKSYLFLLEDVENLFNGSLYLLSSCTNPTTACVAGADANLSGEGEMFTFTPTSTGDYYLVVDSHYVAGDAFSEWSFNLTITEPPANDSCQNATAVTLPSGGPATVQGNTKLSSDAVQLSSSGCTGWSSPGQDLFYSVSLTAGQTYTITLTPDESYDPMLYVFTDCTNPESTCQSGWGSDNIGDGLAETVTVTPSTSGTFYIGVDSYSASESGPFTLEIK